MPSVLLVGQPDRHHRRDAHRHPCVRAARMRRKRRRRGAPAPQPPAGRHDCLADRMRSGRRRPGSRQGAYRPHRGTVRTGSGERQPGPGVSPHRPGTGRRQARRGDRSVAGVARPLDARLRTVHRSFPGRNRRIVPAHHPPGLTQGPHGLRPVPHRRSPAHLAAGDRLTQWRPSHLWGEVHKASKGAS